jgi:hypothetical protein
MQNIQVPCGITRNARCITLESTSCRHFGRSGFGTSGALAFFHLIAVAASTTVIAILDSPNLLEALTYLRSTEGRDDHETL